MKNTLLINGRSVACYLTGRSKSTVPLVLLHGFCEDSSVWAPVLPKLRSARILRIDLPGFGDSELPLTPGMEGYADAVCAVLNELGIERCVLVGHSMGGYTALAFARQYPERLAGLGLVHSHPYKDGPDRIENRRRGIELLRSDKKNQYVAQLFPGLFAPAFAQTNPKVVQRLVRRGRRQPAAGIIAALEGMIQRADHQDTLRTAACPVLFLAGKQDAIIPPDWTLQTACLPEIADVHVLSDVGHMAMFEATEQTVEILLHFLRFCTRFTY